MKVNDPRYYRTDIVKENAKFFVDVYGKEAAIKHCNESMIVEANNPEAQNYWKLILDEINNA